MTIYLILTIFMLLIAFILINLKNFNYKYKNKIFVLISSVMLILISSFRGHNVGTDTKNYISIFESYLLGYKSPHVEGGYSMLNSVLSIVTNNPQAIIIASTIIITTLIGHAVYKLSPHPWLSLFLYVTLYFYFFSFNYMRQFIAIGFIMNSWFFINNKRYLLYIVFVIFGAMFHTTALVALVFYVIHTFNKYYKSIILSTLGITLFILLNTNIFINYIARFFPRYQWYIGDYLDRSGGLMILIVYGGLFFLSVLLKPKKNNYNYSTLMLFLSCSFFMSVLGNQLFIFVRSALYFNIFIIIWIPVLINRFSVNDRKYVAVLIVVFSYIYMLYYLNHNWHHVLPYTFF